MAIVPTARTQNGSVVNVGILLTDAYDVPEFNVTTATTDYDVDTQNADAFSNVKKASWVSIRTNYTITVKFNETTNGAFTVTATDSPYEIGFKFDNLYISNASGNTAAVKLFIK